MVISTKRLDEVAKQLKNNEVGNLMGPGQGKCKFHVTLPEDIKTKAAAQEYALELAKKQWYLTIVKKISHDCEWIGYAPLKQ